MTTEHRICFALHKKPGYSETFIRSHIENMPAHKRYVYGAHFHKDDGRQLVPYVLWGGEYAVKRASGRSFAPFTRLALRRFFRSQRIEVVIAEYGIVGVRVVEACRDAGIPLVVHFHGVDAYARHTVEGNSYGKMFEYASSLVAVSHHMADQLVHLGAPASKVRYNPYGVNPERFHPVLDKENPAHFVAIGRFVEKKAPYLTILAFNQVLQEIPSARLSMVGDGPLMPICRKIAKALGIESAIDFRGIQSPAEVAQLMQEASLFVQHSVVASDNDHEGTPVAVLEAGASGLPVISTRHAGIPDVVLEGVTGLLVDEGDAAMMAQHMIDLANNPGRAREMGINARNHILENFTEAQSNNRLWQIVLSAIEEK